MKAAGRWAWWNQYGSVPLHSCVQRARDAGVGVIAKWGYPGARAAFITAHIPWATERYVYPSQPELEATRLAADVALGAQFAVINAEVEWELLDAEPMERLVRKFRELQPDAELYASVDTRGNRTGLPYQRVLMEHVAGIMPMIYPKTFEQSVATAFVASLDGKDFRGRSVLPTIQTYDGIGAEAVRAQVTEVERRGLPGCQAYTIAHATDAEWVAFVRDLEQEDDMANVEDVLKVLERERQLQTAIGIFEAAKGYARMAEEAPAKLKAQIAYLLAG